MPASRSRTWSAWRLERAAQPYWDILPQKRPKNGWGGNSGSSTPWDIAERCGLASMAGPWWTKRRPQSEPPQGWPGGPSFSATLSTPRPGSRAGGVCLSQRLYAANRRDLSLQEVPARMSAFPRPLLALHPRRLEPEREVCVALRGRSSRRSAGRDIRRTAGRASSWCSLDLRRGPPGGEIALARVARPGAPVLFRPEPGGWPGAGGVGRQRPESGSKRPRGRPSPGIPWPGLSWSPAPSLPAPTGGSQKVVLPNLSVPTRRRRRTNRGPFRAPALPTHSRPRRLRSATQPAAPMLRGNVCILERANCARWLCPPLCPSRCAGWLRPHRTSAATFFHIAYIRPPAGKDVPAIRLGVAALPLIVAVLSLVEPNHVAASLRHSPSRGYVGGVFRGSWLRAWRFRGPVLFWAPLGDGRSSSANRLALVGPLNPRNRGRGRQEGSGVWTVWMQLCRSFASCQDCACIGILGIASERSQPRPILRPSPMFPLCLRVPWLAGPWLPRPGLLSCARTRLRIWSPAAGRLGRGTGRGTQPSSPTAWRAVGLQTGLDIRGGNQGQGLLHHLFGCVRREVSPATGVHRDFDASAAPGLCVGMQEGAPQMVVWAVDIVG